VSRFEFTRNRISLRKCGFWKSVIARNTLVLDYSRQVPWDPVRRCFIGIDSRSVASCQHLSDMRRLSTGGQDDDVGEFMAARSLKNGPGGNAADR
jgi:hypothetical protein